MTEIAPLGEYEEDRHRALDHHYETSEGTPSTSGESIATNGFIYHKVTKLDTLAGLAIKYGVTVSDIKRSNGILSDNVMFAREHVKIPTGSIPVSEEAQVLLARLMSGYGRDASLNARERKAPGTASITQLPGSPTSRSSNFGSEAVDDEPGTPYSRRSDKSSSEPGDVELIERSIGGDGMHTGYGSDRVRRRTKHEPGSSQHNSSSGSGSGQLSHLGAQQISQAAEAAVGWLSNAAAGAAAAAQAALPAAANGLTGSCYPSAARRSFNNSGHGDSSTWDQLTAVISQGGSSLVEKIKRAASQPALGAPPIYAAGIGDVADAVLSRGGHMQPQQHSPAGLRAGSSSRREDPSSIDMLARGIGMLPPRKDTKGD